MTLNLGLDQSQVANLQRIQMLASPHTRVEDHASNAFVRAKDSILDLLRQMYP